VEYSLNGGILRKMHYFIKPGDIKVGLRYTAMSTSEYCLKTAANC